MADQKISELAAVTDLLDADQYVLARAGATKKITGQSLRAVLQGADGWVDDTAATWTRTADQTFTVSGDRTAVFQKGTRLKWTQTTVKYGTVVASSHAAGTTTVTIATTTDYVLTAAAISANFYSYAASPQGYPGWFAYTPSWTSSGTAPAIGNGTLDGRFTIVGKLIAVRARIVAGSTTTFGTGTWALSLPVASSGSPPPTVASVVAWDSSAGNLYVGAWRISGGNIITLAAPAAFYTSAVPFTWAQSDALELEGVYEL